MSAATDIGEKRKSRLITDLSKAGNVQDWAAMEKAAGELRKMEEHVPAPALAWIDTGDIFVPLPKTKWAIEAMQLVAGRPALWAGYGASAKTLSAQSLGLHAAAGRRIWDQFFVPRDGLRVRHVDREQGRHATLKRYQRLAIGHGINREELGDRLQICVFPEIYLTSPGAEATYCRAFEGVDLVIEDALRGAVPGVDENDSTIRTYLDLLTRVSEKTGTAFVMLHHAGKPKEGHADARSVPRGSSAIFDACGSVFVLRCEKGEPIRVSHEKAAAESEGGLVEDFFLSIEDVPNGTNPRGGVRLLHHTAEQIKPPGSVGAKFDTLKSSIATLLREPQPSKNAICARVNGGNKSDKLQAIDELLHERRITEVGGMFRAC